MALDELCQFAHVLVVACLAYMVLSGASTFIPAITMEPVSEELGMSLGMLSALASAGSGAKAVIVLLLMGPALDAFGPHTLIQWCLLGSAACNVALALAPTAFLYGAAFLTNFFFNSLSEQPAFIVLFATYFDARLGIACTLIASAYSLAGLTLPLLLGPMLVAFGWRTLWLVLAACCLLATPVSCYVLKPGPISLNEKRKHFSLRGVIGTVVMMHRLQRAGRDVDAADNEEVSSNSFTGGRLSTAGSRMSVVEPFALLHSLGKSGRLEVAVVDDDDDDELPAAKPCDTSASASIAAAKGAQQAGDGGRVALRTVMHLPPTPAAQAAAEAANANSSIAAPAAPSRHFPPPPPKAAPMNMSFGEALGTLKFWALSLSAFAFFVHGGQVRAPMVSVDLP